MNRVLIYTIGSAGDVHPFIGLGMGRTCKLIEALLPR